MHSYVNAALMALGLLASGATHANLVNGSFEAGSFLPPSNQTMTLAPGAVSISGWQTVNDSLAWIGAGNPWGLEAQDGNRFLDLSDYAAGAPFGGVQQTFSTQPGYEYTTEFYLGSSNRWGRPSVLTVSAAGQSGTFSSPSTGTNNDWQPFSFSFVANSSTTTLSFVGAAGANYIGLDNVSATVTAVPEPMTLVLMVAGVAAIGLRAHRQRRPQ